MAVAGVLFDFDGVVADSLSSHLRAWAEANRQCFKKKLNPDIYLKITGHATPRIAGILATEAGERDKADLLAKHKEAWLQENRSAVPLFPGVKEVLNNLDARRIPYAIASNASISFIQQVLGSHNIEIATILGRESVTRAKPAPDVYLLAATKLRIPIDAHERTVVFEDSTHGLNAAVSAKMFPVGITSQRDSEALIKAGARVTFPSVYHAWESQFLLLNDF